MKIARRIQRKAIVLSMFGDIHIFPLLKEENEAMKNSHLGKIKQEFEEDLIELAVELEDMYNTVYLETQDMYLWCKEKLGEVEIPQQIIDSVEDVDSIKYHTAKIMAIKDMMNEWVTRSEISDEIVAQMCSDKIGIYMFMSDKFKQRAISRGDFKEAKHWAEFSLTIKDHINNIVGRVGDSYVVNCNALMRELRETCLVKSTEILEWARLLQLEYTEDDVNEINAVYDTLKTGKELEKHLEQEGFVYDRANGSHRIYKNENGETRVIPWKKGTQVLAPKTRKRILGM